MQDFSFLGGRETYEWNFWRNISGGAWKLRKANAYSRIYGPENFERICARLREPFPILLELQTGNFQSVFDRAIFYQISVINNFEFYQKFQICSKNLNL